MSKIFTGKLCDHHESSNRDIFKRLVTFVPLPSSPHCRGQALIVLIFLYFVPLCIVSRYGRASNSQSSGLHLPSLGIRGEEQGTLHLFLCFSYSKYYLLRWNHMLLLCKSPKFSLFWCICGANIVWKSEKLPFVNS